MKIAVTGGTGFLGKYVVEKIKKNNWTPVIITRQQTGDLSSDCEIRSTNYSKNDLKEELYDIDAMVHLAATRGSQGKIFEFHDNEVLTQNIYDACIEKGITNIVYTSTISVYSDEQLLPWTEDNLPAPALMYGISKLTNEHIGNIYSAQKGLYIKNLRLAHLFGFNEKNNYMINRFFRQAFNRDKLEVSGKSVAKREFLYAKDAAKAIICALSKNELSGTFNIGSQEAFTNQTVAETVNEIFENNENLVISNPNEDEGIQSSYMNSQKAKIYLDYTPDYTFKTAIAEIYTLMRRLDNVPIWY